MSSLEEEISKIIVLFSSVSGLPITEQTFEPLPVEHCEKKHYGPCTKIPFSLIAKLGSKEQEYVFDWRITFSDEYDRGFLPTTMWELRYNGAVCSSSHYTTMNASAGTSEMAMRELALEEIEQSIGGIDVSDPIFMDYDQFTLHGLNTNDHDGYFKKVYLAFMTHLKQEGHSLPPIISKRQDIRYMMMSGDRIGIGQALKKIMSGNDASNKRYALHMRMEAWEIENLAAMINDRKNPTIPLTKKFSLKHAVIPGESEYPYNILVVENDVLCQGMFTEQVHDALCMNGSYGSTTLFTEINLSRAMMICATEQIDMVLFEWIYPSYGEAFMFNLKSDCKTASQRGALDMSDPEEIAHTLLGWKQTAEERDIRKSWMDKIAYECRAKGVRVPPHFIVRSEEHLENIGTILLQYRDKMIERHISPPSLIANMQCYIKE
jgi:hypothetical protein